MNLFRKKPGTNPRPRSPAFNAADDSPNPAPRPVSTEPRNPWWELRDIDSGYWNSGPYKLPDNHGIRGVEWFNVDSGARLLVWGDGTWESGGVIRLFHLLPESVGPVDLTTLVFGHATQYSPGDPQEWTGRKDSAIDVVRKHLGSPPQC